MSSRIFQSVIVQMKEATDRMIGVIDADGETVYDNTGETVLSQTGPQSERLEWGKAMLQTTYEDIGRR